VPIRHRLAAVVALVTLTLIGVGGYLFDRQLRSSVMTSVDDGLAGRSEAIVRTLREAPAPVDQAALSSSLIGRRESLAAVYDPQHHVVAASPSDAGDELLRRRNLDRLAEGPQTFTREVRGPTGDREEARVMATAVPRADGQWIVVVGSSLATTELALDRVHLGLLIGGVVGLVAAAGGAWALAAAALRPVESMRREVATIRGEGLGRVALPGTRDELAALAVTLNDLLDQLDEAWAHERRLVADAGHELRTPLAVLQTELELAGRPGRNREELADAVAHATVEVDRLSRLANALLLLARLDEGSADIPKEPTPVLAVAEAAAAAAAQRAQRSGVEVRVAVSEDVTVQCDRDRLRQAVDNLVDNAVRQSPPGATVTISAEGDDRTTTVTVDDEGPGFQSDFLPHAFERFSQADTARRRGGAGLGLAIVAAIARAHDGRAWAQNRTPCGARVAIELRTGEPSRCGPTAAVPGQAPCPEVLAAPSGRPSP
jgi:two-component system OmpR family sensor kinase